MDSKLLIRRRASHKTKLTQFKSYLDALLSCCKSLSSIQINELNIRLSKLDDLYSEYDSVQTDIENLSEIPDDQYKDRETFETQYYGTIAAARDALDKYAAAACTAEAGADSASVTGSGTAIAGRPTLKLPVIHLPSFSGRYQEWLEFHDTYTSLIHNNSAIPNINKFHYLRAALKDSAACIIQALDFSAANYAIAWQLLCERFHNSRLLINNHIQSIFNIEQISKESAKALRCIIDTLNKNLRALKTLKLPTEHWDVLIIHIVSNKLDSVTCREWEVHRSKTEESIPTLIEFNNFLRGRADLLETVEEQSNNKRRHSDSSVIRSRAFITSSSSNFDAQKGVRACPICKYNHAIFRCYKFKAMPIQKRIEQVKSLRLCLNCLRGHSGKECLSGPCTICSERHNSLLHQEKRSQTTDAQPSSVVLSASHKNTHTNDEFNQSDIVTQNISLSSTNNNLVLLSTAIINVFNHNTNHIHSVRVLLDNGSTSSFITETLAKQLDLKTFSTRTSVEGLNYQTSQITKRCEVTIASCYDETYKTDISCFVVPHITQSLPIAQIDYIKLNIPSHIQLADPTFSTPSQVDMLLGADIFWDILGSQRISLGKTRPILSETRLGWLVSGVIHSQYTSSHNSTVHCHHIQNIDLQDQLDRFFELETVTPSVNNLSKEQNICEQLFTQTTTRQPDGRFVVNIPLKQSPDNLGDSYEQATARFLSLERRFKREPKFKQLYSEFIQEYIDLGHMSENRSVHKHNTVQNYLPHHGVLRETSLTTKLRVVFDASAVTTSGLSFNDIQRVGPIVQNDLISILTRFRQHKYVVTSDVEKMFRMVSINRSQHNLQQILWRFDPTQEIKSYNLLTATYGTASAPWLTTRCIVELGKLSEDKSIREAIIHDYYVDDFISGHNNTTELIRICKGVINQMKSAQFHLRKWHSNNTDILEQLHGKNNIDTLLNLSKDERTRTLGLIWACKEDCFVYSVKDVEFPNVNNKRTVLSAISQIFDPLGLINPSILVGKIILQKLWASKISWDETIPTDVAKQWSKFVSSLTHLNNFKIPRCVVCDDPIRVEIHAFSDASLHAYSACVYFRSITANNTISVHLVMAKSRVAPIKFMTMPRLELSGALLSARLVKKVNESVRLTIDSCTYWCDSTIVLGWIRSSNAHLLKQFVSNRINEIVECSEPNSWRYVPTGMNPADIGSRGLEPEKLQSTNLWWKGPSFLLESESHWPQHPTQTNESDSSELKVQCHTILKQQSKHNNNDSKSDTSFMHRYSDINKLQHVTAYVLRFIHNCRNPHKKHTSYLKIKELRLSMYILCKLSQMESFPDEYHILSKKGQLKIKNQLVKLNPFYQEDYGLIRVGGRLSNSNYDYDTKHPILLHASHYITQLIFKHYHTSLMHAGPQLLLSSIRHKYWTINGRNLARKSVHSCLTCLRFSGKTIQPIMGNLPKERVQGEFPFVNSAVDYAGPILIANKKGRGCRHIKAYICVFVCLAVKAVHIELVTDLTKECFLAALNRFIARRGRPACLFSDNGTNFVGACNDLARFLKQCNQEVSAYAAQHSIIFKFSPAYSPHFNSMAESAVKSIKHHLKRVLAMAFLTYEEMNTLLVQIEAILNSRPITPLSSDPSDLVPLTPSHFLIGRTLTLLPSLQVQDHSLHLLPRYQRVQQLKAHFWNRFYKEYISELQKRVKWHRSNAELREGDMMLVKDDRLPPNRWMIGRITNLHKGSSDGVARVADLMTSAGTIRRGFNRLVPLLNLEQDVPTPGPC